MFVSTFERNLPIFFVCQIQLKIHQSASHEHLCGLNTLWNIYDNESIWDTFDLVNVLKYSKMINITNVENLKCILYSVKTVELTLEV